MSHTAPPPASAIAEFDQAYAGVVDLIEDLCTNHRNMLADLDYREEIVIAGTAVALREQIAHAALAEVTAVMIHQRAAAGQQP